VDNLAVDVVFSLITAIPLRDYGDKADPEFSKVAIYLHLGLSPSQRLFVLRGWPIPSQRDGTLRGNVAQSPSNLTGISFLIQSNETHSATAE
jgi:hypothetical protein